MNERPFVGAIDREKKCTHNMKCVFKIKKTTDMMPKQQQSQSKEEEREKKRIGSRHSDTATAREYKFYSVDSHR